MTTTSTGLKPAGITLTSETPAEPLAVVAARAACALEQSVQRMVLASDENLGHLERQASPNAHGCWRP